MPEQRGRRRVILSPVFLLKSESLDTCVLECFLMIICEHHLSTNNDDQVNFLIVYFKWLNDRCFAFSSEQRRLS